jgi:hypothetical protein
METRTVTIDAATVNDAREAAIAALRASRFDPLRVISSPCIGFVRFDDKGMFSGIFRYKVEVQGIPLEENEARAIYGDR